MSLATTFVRLLRVRDIVGLHKLVLLNPDIVKYNTSAGTGLFRWICGNEVVDDPDFVSQFVEMGIPLMDESRWHALHYAALFHKPSLMRYFLDLAPECVNSRTNTGRTIMDISLSQSFYKVIPLLVDRGAKRGNETMLIIQKQAHLLEQLQQARKFARTRAVIVCGLLRCRACVIRGNGMDVLRMIARCIWSHRGLVSYWDY